MNLNQALNAAFDANTLALLTQFGNESAIAAQAKAAEDVWKGTTKSSKMRADIAKRTIKTSIKSKTGRETASARSAERRQIAAYILDPENRTTCCYITDRNDVCDKEATRVCDGLVHTLPFEPRFCTRHINLLNTNEDKFATVESKLEWVAAFVEAANNLPNQVPQQPQPAPIPQQVPVQPQQAPQPAPNWPQQTWEGLPLKRERNGRPQIEDVTHVKKEHRDK